RSGTGRRGQGGGGLSPNPSAALAGPSMSADQMRTRGMPPRSCTTRTLLASGAPQTQRVRRRSSEVKDRRRVRRRTDRQGPKRRIMGAPCSSVKGWSKWRSTMTSSIGRLLGGGGGGVEGLGDAVDPAPGLERERAVALELGEGGLGVGEGGVV